MSAGWGRWAVVTSLVMCLAACGSEPVADEDGGAGDAGGAMDAGGRDGGSDEDAGGARDAGPPEPCDAPGAIETVACGECGTVQRFCTAGRVWSYGVCDEGECPSDDCTTPGVIETVACGMCGWQQRFCSADRVWEYDACTGERSCLPGTTRDVACGMCGTLTERCAPTCTWVPGTCGGEGTCAPGTTLRTADGCPAGQTRLVRCTGACAPTEVLEPCSAPSMDAGVDGGRDAGLPDAGTPDAGRDAGMPDAGAGDAGPPPVTIGAIQRGEIAVGTRVTIRGVVVTAVRSDTIWVQDPAGGSSYAGVKVYVGSAHGAMRNDRVDVSGRVEEYFGDTELSSARVTVTGVASPITPLPLTVAQAQLEQYEGMLVRLTDITSYQLLYDCSVDSPLCTDANLWQVNGAAGILVYDATYEGSDWGFRVGASSVTGVMSWRFERRRIQPRIAADLPF